MTDNDKAAMVAPEQPKTAFETHCNWRKRYESLELPQKIQVSCPSMSNEVWLHKCSTWLQQHNLQLRDWESTHGHYQLQIARIPFRPSCSWCSRRILCGKVQELQFGMLVAWQSPKAKNQNMVGQYLKHSSLRMQRLVATPDLSPLHSSSHAKANTSPTFWRNSDCIWGKED
jgi:hypothetical protein